MNYKVFDKFPTLETDRLILSEIKLADADIIFKANSSLTSLKYIARDPFINIDEAEKKIIDYYTWFTEKKTVMFKYMDKENNEPIGYGGIFNISPTANKGELGYMILEEHWRKGYASEAAKCLINFAFNDLQLNKLFALIDPENTGSKKTVEKYGFEVEGLLKQNDFAQGRYFNVLYYALFNE